MIQQLNNRLILKMREKVNKVPGQFNLTSEKKEEISCPTTQTPRLLVFKRRGLRFYIGFR